MAVKEKNVIYIPYWIQELCGRHGLPLTAIMDYSKINKFLSLEEQALFLGLQEYELFDCQFNSEGIPTSGCRAYTDEFSERPDSRALVSSWKKTVGADNEANSNAISSAETLSYCNDATRLSLTARLFAKESRTDRFKAPYKTVDLDGENVGVIIFPGFFNLESQPAFKMLLLVDILKVLYVYNTVATVSRTLFFRKYLEELAVKNR